VTGVGGKRHGTINFDMVRHLVSIAALSGKQRKAGEWMCGPVELAFRWDASGNIV
jgi:hypothetical protein